MITSSRRSEARGGWLHKVVAAVTLSVIAVAGLSTFAVAASAVEPGTGSGGIFVQDGANALSDGTEQYIRQANEKWEKDGKLPAQLLVVTADKVPDGQTIEEWSIRLAEKYKPGDKEKDTGLVYVVAVDDHKDRLEVGYGLEDKIPDAMAAKMIKEAEAEYKQGDYDAGVKALVKAVGDQLYGDGWTPSKYSGSHKLTPADVVGYVCAGALGLVLVFIVPLVGPTIGLGLLSVLYKLIPESANSSSAGSSSYSSSRGSSSSSSSSSSSFGGGSFGGGGASGSW